MKFKILKKLVSVLCSVSIFMLFTSGSVLAEGSFGLESVSESLNFNDVNNRLIKIQKELNNCIESLNSSRTYLSTLLPNLYNSEKFKALKISVAIEESINFFEYIKNNTKIVTVKDKNILTKIEELFSEQIKTCERFCEKICKLKYDDNKNLYSIYDKGVDSKHYISDKYIDDNFTTVSYKWFELTNIWKEDVDFILSNPSFSDLNFKLNMQVQRYNNSYARSLYNTIGNALTGDEYELLSFVTSLVDALKYYDENFQFDGSIKTVDEKKLREFNRLLCAVDSEKMPFDDKKYSELKTEDILNFFDEGNGAADFIKDKLNENIYDFAKQTCISEVGVDEYYDNIATWMLDLNYIGLSKEYEKLKNLNTNQCALDFMVKFCSNLRQILSGKYKNSFSVSYILFDIKQTLNRLLYCELKNVEHEKQDDLLYKSYEKSINKFECYFNRCVCNPDKTDVVRLDMLGYFALENINRFVNSKIGCCYEKLKTDNRIEKIQNIICSNDVKKRVLLKLISTFSNKNHLNIYEKNVKTIVDSDKFKYILSQYEKIIEKLKSNDELKNEYGKKLLDELSIKFKNMIDCYKKYYKDGNNEHENKQLNFINAVKTKAEESKALIEKIFNIISNN